MLFSSREEAGQRLGEHLLQLGMQTDVVLGLPRGGVVVAAEVAHALKRPLDVLVVRKIGHPQFREFAVGALAEQGVVLLDRHALQTSRVMTADLEEVVAEETDRLENYSAKFHHGSAPVLTGKRVLIVDDGLATGATAEAAVMSAKKQGASSVTIATPVASRGAVDRLTRVADEVIVLKPDPNFEAVGQYYSSFPQTSDREVLDLLHVPAT
jgi:putative phosphoribosyl transferase